MAIYLIPNYKIPDLEKQINKIRRKGAEVRFVILDDNVIVEAPELGRHVTITCSNINVEGTYIINGWRFIATIEHSSPENIIRVADYSMQNRIPERYRTANRNCEHCNILRDRKDTFLVYNQDEDEWKQVGRTCLQSYTNGLNAETCAEFANVMNEIWRLSLLTNQGEFDEDEARNSNAFSYSMEYVKGLAYEYVKSNGYTSGQTGKDFNSALLEGNLNNSASDQELNEVTDWLENAGDGDWIRNARAVWNKDVYETRDASLLTSAIGVFFKHKSEEAARQARLNNPTNSFAGNVGDKVELTIADVSVAYTRTGGNYYHAISYPVYRIVGTDGKIYLWGSSNNVELKVGDLIQGTIKKLNEKSNGEKQTELTRCKVIEHGRRTTGFFR